MQRPYTFGGQRIAMRQGDVVYYLHADHLGSVSVVSDGSDALLAAQRYYPYGEVRWRAGTLPTDFTFTGQRWEAGLGLLDYRARYYDPTTGRFLTRDSFPGLDMLPTTQHPYVYMGNNPVNLGGATHLVGASHFRSDQRTIFSAETTTTPWAKRS